MTECVFCHRHVDRTGHPQARLSPGETCPRCGCTAAEERAETERHQSRQLTDFGGDSQ